MAVNESHTSSSAVRAMASSEAATLKAAPGFASASWQSSSRPSRRDPEARRSAWRLPFFGRARRDTPQGGEAEIPVRGRRPGRMIALAVVLATLSAIGFDFASFVRTVTSAPPPPTTRADAIVVLTGGAARIPYALDLLKDGRAERMLISGVDPRVSENAVLSRLAPVARFLAGCCIDFGREASNTVGNAAEARKWAEEKGFHSLFVVTSAYHIPRSLAEFGDALPGRTLIPYPVARPGLELDRWYERPETIRLVVSEYLKFTLVRLRLLAERLGLANAASVSQAAGGIPHKPGPA